VNTDSMKIIGIGIANALVALSGALVAQYQGFADIGMGIGTVVAGLASVIIGEAIIPPRSVGMGTLGAITGSVVYRLAGVSCSPPWFCPYGSEACHRIAGNSSLIREVHQAGYWY